MYTVLMHNDDYTTMEFVVEALIAVFRKSPTEANRIMEKGHDLGMSPAQINKELFARLGTNSREVMQQNGRMIESLQTLKPPGTSPFITPQIPSNKEPELKQRRESYRRAAQPVADIEPERVVRKGQVFVKGADGELAATPFAVTNRGRMLIDGR